MQYVYKIIQKHLVVPESRWQNKTKQKHGGCRVWGTDLSLSQLPTVLRYQIFSPFPFASRLWGHQRLGDVSETNTCSTACSWKNCIFSFQAPYCFHYINKSGNIHWKKIFLITFTQNLGVCTRKGFHHMARIRSLFHCTSEQVTVELITSIIHLNFFFLFLLYHTWIFKGPQAAIRLNDNYTYEYYICHKHSIYSDHLQLVINNKMKFLKFS